MQGADKVNDEFEVGFDAYFEYRWRRAEQAGMAAARQKGLMRLDQVRYAVIERDGKVSIVPEGEA